MANKPFRQTLPRYSPDTPDLRNAVKNALVERLELYKEEKRIALTVRFDTYLDGELRRQLCEGIAKAVKILCDALGIDPETLPEELRID